MKNIRPLLLRRIDLDLPLFRMRRLSLHQHLREVDRLSPHTHPYAQILFYLGGHGTQLICGEPFHATPGSAVWIPPKTRHAFVEETGRRPICLTIDLDWRGKAGADPVVAAVSGSDAARVRTTIAALTKIHATPDQPPGPAAAAHALQILDLLLCALGLIPRIENPAQPGVIRRFESLLADPETAARPLQQLAGGIGYHRDALNRVFKRNTGVTLGQFRAEHRARQAIRLLRTARRVQDVAEALRFQDPNYFARWLKKQTGRSPREFLSGSGSSSTV